MDPAKTPQPYEVTLIKDGYKEMESWTRTREENGWRWSGKCPHCKHDASKFIPTEVTALGVKAMEARAETGRYAVQCNCTDAHPDQPEGESGCGAYWGIEVAHGEDEEASEAAGT